MESIETATMAPTTADKIDKGNHYLEIKNLDKGGDKTFSFYQLQIKTPEAASELFGRDTVTALINRSLAFSQRTKAANKLAYDTPAETAAEIERRKSAGETLLISESEAESYRPGERELTSPESMLKEVKKMQKEAKQLAASGDTEGAKSLIAEANALFKKAWEIAQANAPTLD